MTSGGPAYGRSRRKRALDLAIALPAIVLLSPLLAVLAAAVWMGSGPPVFFRHERVGRDGRVFRLMKFRSMRVVPGDGPAVTSADDPRVTGIGRLLRRTKLDELPQLLNVVRGEMSLVGPRPEVPRYVGLYGAAERRILEVPPGLTDPASLAYRDEEEILGGVPTGDRERFYVQELMPRKLALSLGYAAEAGIASDLAIIARTGLTVLGLRPR